MSEEYNDTNQGIGSAYDSPEEKEIERLQRKLTTALATIAEKDKLIAESEKGAQS